MRKEQKDEEELKESWYNEAVQYWEVDDDATGEEMSYDEFEENIGFYLKQVKDKKIQNAFIREIYR